MAIWMRKDQDSRLLDLLMDKWDSHDSKYKLRSFQGSFPTGSNPKKLPSSSQSSVLTQSDHFSFWYHGSSLYNKTLPSILLSDMSKSLPLYNFKNWLN